MDFIARFHPVVVHLPIGILLLAVFFEWISFVEKYREVKRVVPITLALGSISAALSCFTGYLLAQHTANATPLVQWHQWMAIGTTIYSFGYLKARKIMALKPYSRLLAALLAVGLTITGHMGGTITHGENFLFSPSNDNDANEGLSAMDLAEAKFYTDLVKPILENKCYQCHGSSKQKGKLRLDVAEGIERGGKSGKLIVASKPDEGEMMHRILLSMDNDNHMPPKEKPQLTNVEIDIIRTWILSGADFNGTVASSGHLEMLQRIVSSAAKTEVIDIPKALVNEPSQSVLNELRTLGVAIVPVSGTSNYLSANLVGTTDLNQSIALLLKVKDQLVWLKTGGVAITDNHLISLGLLNQLHKLDLQGAKVSENGFEPLNKLSNLVYLNLNGTSITARKLVQLKSLKALKSIYVYQTGVKEPELEEIKRHFPEAAVIWGNFMVPTLQSDTTVLTSPLKK